MELRRNLATMYAHEHYLNEPPTVEALRYATEQYLRTRGPVRESPIEVSNMEPLHTDIPQPELHPQATTNASGSPHAPIAQPHAPQQFAPPKPPEVRTPPTNVRSCFLCQQVGHSARDCPNRNRAYKPSSRFQPQPQINHVATPLQPTPVGNIPSESDFPPFCLNCAQSGHELLHGDQSTVPEEQVPAAGEVHFQTTSKSLSTVSSSSSPEIRNNIISISPGEGWYVFASHGYVRCSAVTKTYGKWGFPKP